MGRACTDMVFCENDDFKFLNTAKNIKKYAHNMHHNSRAHGAVLSLKTSLSLTRNMNVKVAIEIFLDFPKYRSLDSGNFSRIVINMFATGNTFGAGNL